MEYSELDKELNSLTRRFLKEERMSTSVGYKSGMKNPSLYPKNLNPWDTGITDRGWTGLSSDIRVLTYKEKFGNNPSEVYGKGGEMKVDTVDSGSNTWKKATNSFKKMDWEQPEPNESDFQSNDVQSVASKEMARLNHNKSNVKNAYKKHELPDNQGFSHLEKMNTEKGSDDPLLWKHYRQYFKANNKTKN